MPQALGQARILQSLANGAGDLWRQHVPLDARVFIDTLAGNRETLTERALTAQQRATAAEMIQRRQGQRTQQLHQETRNTVRQPPEDAVRQRRNVSTANRGQGYIGRNEYGAFGSQRAYNLAAGDDGKFKNEFENLEQIRTTLGRFRYEMTPEGIRIQDSYDFENPERAERVAQLARMAPPRRVLSALSDAAVDIAQTPQGLAEGASMRDILTAIGGSLGQGLIGANGRKVDMLLPYVPLSRDHEVY